MPNIFEAFEADPDLIKEGVWFEIEDPSTGEYVCAFKCRPSDGDFNLDFKQGIAETTQRFEHAGKSTESVDFLAQIYSRYIITDWKDVEGPEGPIEFSQAAAAGVLSRMPKLLTTLVRHTTKWTNFRREFAEDVLGNSPKSLEKSSRATPKTAKRSSRRTASAA